MDLLATQPARATTHLPDSRHLATLADLRSLLQPRVAKGPVQAPALIDAAGRRIELPVAVVEAFQQVIAAMSQGHGVTVAPHHTLLSTQEAADFLGMPRVSLVRALESGELPFQKPGRQRRVMLADVLAYQAATGRHRREARPGTLGEVRARRPTGTGPGSFVHTG